MLGQKSELEEGFVRTNGIRMHYAAQGRGPLVLLLHGFPEFWYSWRYQIPSLAEAGFRAVAPDLRGWGLTDKPRGVSPYEVRELLRDICGLLEALGYERGHIVGHDWGGVLAWLFAHKHESRVGSLIIINAPHPRGYLALLRKEPRQWLMSKYALFFQLPRVPEAMLRRLGGARIRRIFVGSSHPDTFSEADLLKYVENALRPYALTAGVNYYRALARPHSYRFFKGLRVLSTPALIVWGEKDPFLLKRNAEVSRRWASNLRTRYIPDAGHWVQLEKPQLVNQQILDFLKGVPLRLVNTTSTS